MKIPQETRCLSLEDLNASERKKDKKPYVSPKITIQPIQLDFDLMATSTFIRIEGPDNPPKSEDWQDEGQSTYDFDF